MKQRIISLWRRICGFFGHWPRRSDDKTVSLGDGLVIDTAKKQEPS